MAAMICDILLVLKEFLVPVAIGRMREISVNDIGATKKRIHMLAIIGNR